MTKAAGLPFSAKFMGSIRVQLVSIHGIKSEDNRILNAVKTYSEPYCVYETQWSNQNETC